MVNSSEKNCPVDTPDGQPFVCQRGLCIQGLYFAWGPRGRILITPFKPHQSNLIFLKASTCQKHQLLILLCNSYLHKGFLN